MSNLPRSVQAQAERANEAQQAILNPVLSPEIAQKLQAEKAVDDQQDQPKQEPDNSVQPANTNEDAIYWRNRFNVLQGKYNAEIPALNTKIKELDAQLSAAKTQSNEGDAKDRAVDALTDMSSDDIEEFGPELVALIERISRKTSTQANADVSQLKSKVDQIAQEKQDSAEAQFWTDLGRLVSDYQSINSRPDFHRWLEGEDAMSGRARQSLLVDAQRANNAVRVAEFFNQFKQYAASNPVPPSKQHPDQTRSNAVVEPDAKAWSKAAVKEFYKKAADGFYANKPELKQQIEREIFDALAAGLVS